MVAPESPKASKGKQETAKVQAKVNGGKSNKLGFTYNAITTSGQYQGRPSAPSAPAAGAF